MINVLKQIIDTIQLKKKTFLNVFILIASISSINYILSDRIYVSEMKLVHNGGGASPSSSFRGLFGSFNTQNDMESLSSATKNYDMIPEVLSSRSFMDKILNKDFMYEDQTKKLYLILTDKDNSFLEDNLTQLSARKKLNQFVSVSKGLNTPVISISVKTNNKDLSYNIANEMLSQLKKDLTSFQTDRVEKRINVINVQIESSRSELEQKEEELRVFRINNSSRSQSPTLLLEEQRKLRDISTLSETYNSLKFELELAKIKFLEQANVLQVIDEPNFPIQKTSPRLRYMLIGIIFNYIFISFIIIYTSILANSELGKEIRRLFSRNNY
tara:strand:- start:3571 stop:4554 length:984 start_codon:yes stop_codon:yes gene_type:complete